MALDLLSSPGFIPERRSTVDVTLTSGNSPAFEKVESPSFRILSESTPKLIEE